MVISRVEVGISRVEIRISSVEIVISRVEIVISRVEIVISTEEMPEGSVETVPGNPGQGCDLDCNCKALRRDQFKMQNDRRRLVTRKGRNATLMERAKTFYSYESISRSVFFIHEKHETHIPEGSDDLCDG